MSQQEQLISSINNNDYDAVVSLIESGADPNCLDQYVRHLYMYCVGIGVAGLVSQNIDSCILFFFKFFFVHRLGRHCILHATILTQRLPNI